MTRSICMKLLGIIFSDMNFEIMYRIFVSDVTITKGRPTVVFFCKTGLPRSGSSDASYPYES